VRIIHYGDSQIEEDRISATLRDSLQTRFGGGGPGLLPVLDQYYNFSISEGSSAAPRRYVAYGPAELRGAGGRYGPLAQKSHYDGTVTTTLYPVKDNDSPSRYFDRLTFLSAGSDITVRCNGVTQEMEASDSIRHIRFNLPDSTERVSFTHSGSHDIYGVMLDREAGVSVDNVPMRGCSGTVFTMLNAEQLSDYYNNENVRLIILQYGGNSVPFTRTDKQISEFCEDISRQITYLQEQAPGARILFIGPSDMSTSIQGKMQTYRHLPAYVDSLRVTAGRAGAAYWDMYAAMGGQGSMVQWVRQSPPLANEDYIHFTRKGAARIGGMLYETLMLYYDYYRLKDYE
jgi:lysophospholipase L1-like esterase